MKIVFPSATWLSTIADAAGADAKTHICVNNRPRQMSVTGRICLRAASKMSAYNTVKQFPSVQLANKVSAATAVIVSITQIKQCARCYVPPFASCSPLEDIRSLD